MRTIRRQLLIGLLFGTLVCTLVAGGATYLKIQDEANELFDAQLRQIAASLPAQLVPQQKLPGIEDPEDDIIVQVWDRNGKLVYASQSAQLLPRYRTTGLSTVRALNDAWRIYGETRYERFVQVAQPTSVRRELAAGLALRSLIPFLLMVPMLAVLIGIVVGRSLQPLHRLAEAVRRRSPTALQPLQMQQLPPEIAPVLESLNDLLRQLDQALTSQRAFVADAAHELRSPLAALKLQLQLAERATHAEQRAAAFTKLHERLDRSTHLVEQLLTLARYESNFASRQMQEVDLHKLAQFVVSDKSTLAESKGIDLGVEISDAAPLIKGHTDSLRVMLNNLVDNAIRYTPPGGRIDVSIISMDGRAALQVADTGPGIPLDDRTRAFDRFYRGSGTEVVGSGLGLSIVKNIAEQHGAQIHLEEGTRQQGLVVTVVFGGSISK